jgi:hypothetical protein
MKKQLDRRQSILKRDFRRYREDFWADSEDDSVTRIIHKKTGFITHEPKFKIRSTLPRRHKVIYYISKTDL